MKAQKKYSILYVDDEPENLTVFKSAFRRHYKVYVANSANEGLHLLNNENIQLIISDQRMPGMTGVEFLSYTTESFPDTVRMILTGYSDIDAVIQSINKGRVYRYISKPWDKNELKITIDNALEAYQLRQQNKQLIQNLEKKVKQRTAKIEEQKEELTTQAEHLKQINKELNSKNKRLEELNREKNSLMRIVAHDLKSPLNNVYSLLQLIEEEGNANLSETQKEYLQLIYNVVESGNDLIQDLLDINSIEEFQTKMDYSDINIEEFFGQLTRVHKKNAAQKDIAIHFQKDIKKPTFYTDANYLQRIFDNLLSNAVKFSPFGRNVYVAVKSSDSEMQFSVKDEGPGFNDDDKKLIFRKFQKLTARPTNNEHSSGLGLSIAKTLVERMEGQIELTTQSGKGSEFVVKLPPIKNKNQN